jgi:signal transduction histidine kinase
VVAPLTDAAAAARRAAIWLGVAMLGATALLATVLLVLVRGITRPLGELAALADRIATGERRERPDVQRADEIGALASALDSMTARLADYEERLAARSRRAALGDMSARLAHEIRNPLTGIKLHLQLLAERSTGADATRFALLLAEVERLELMVASTLVLGSQAPLAPEPLDLSALAADVLELMEPTLQHRGIVVEQQLARLPRLRADRARLRQSLLNLIVNAAEALPAGGRVRLTTCADAEERCALLAVEDSGPGLPEGLPDGEMPTSKPFGLGIGLVVCREVAAAHGGALRVERGAALGGARLVLALPWAPDPTVPESP